MKKKIILKGMEKKMYSLILLLAIGVMWNRVTWAEVRGDSLECRTLVQDELPDVNPDSGCAIGVPGRSCIIKGLAGVCREIPVPLSSLVGCVCVPPGTKPEESEGTASAGGSIPASCNETRVFTVNTGLPQSILVTLPDEYGGGMKVLNYFTGVFNVSTQPISGEPNLCNIVINSGIFNAPSFELADSTPTGENTFTFVYPALSSGTLNLITGEYQAEASGRIVNSLYPAGIPTRGVYRGIVNFAEGSVTFDSTTIDYITVTLINLTSFTATGGDGEVVLNWTTASEIDNAGFNIWRRTKDKKEGFIKINPTLIPAEGSPVQGATYTYIDTNVKNGITYYYLLEDIDSKGVSTFHGKDVCTYSVDPNCVPVMAKPHKMPHRR